MLWLALCHSLRFSGFGQALATQVPWSYDFVHLTWADYRAVYWRGSARWTWRGSLLKTRLELAQEVLWGNAEAVALTGALWDESFPLKGYLLAKGPGCVQRVWFKEGSAELSLGGLSLGFGRRFVDWGLAWFTSPLRLFSSVQRLGWDPESFTPADCAWGSASLGPVSAEAVYSLDTSWGLRLRAFSPVELGALGYFGRDTALGLFSSINALEGALKLEAAFFRARRWGFSAEWTRTFSENFLLIQYFLNPWAGEAREGLFARELVFASLQRGWEGIWEAQLTLGYAPSDGSAMAMASLSRLFTGLKLTLGASYTRGREFTSQFGAVRPAGALSFELF